MGDAGENVKQKTNKKRYNSHTDLGHTCTKAHPHLHNCVLVCSHPKAASFEGIKCPNRAEVFKMGEDPYLRALMMLGSVMGVGWSPWRGLGEFS